MSEVGNQFKSQTLSQLLTSSIKTVGGRVFPDLNASNDLSSLVTVVDAWRSTHAQAYGNAIPDTGVAFTANPTDLGVPETIVEPSNNEVVLLNALSIENAGSSNLEYKVLLGDTVVIKDTIAGGTEQPYPAEVKGLMLSKGQSLSVMATGGTATDLILNASGVKTCI